jgi:hypothetical protein
LHGVVFDIFLVGCCLAETREAGEATARLRECRNSQHHLGHQQVSATARATPVFLLGGTFAAPVAAMSMMTASRSARW